MMLSTLWEDGGELMAWMLLSDVFPETCGEVRRRPGRQNGALSPGLLRPQRQRDVALRVVETIPHVHSAIVHAIGADRVDR